MRPCCLGARACPLFLLLIRTPLPLSLVPPPQELLLEVQTSGAHADVAALALVLAQQLGQRRGEDAAALTTLRWLHALVRLSPRQLLPHTAALLADVLPCLGHEGGCARGRGVGERGGRRGRRGGRGRAGQGVHQPSSQPGQPLACSYLEADLLCVTILIALPRQCRQRDQRGGTAG